MPFQRILDDLAAATADAEGAVLVDHEGEAIVHAGTADDFALKLLAAHLGIIVGQIRAASERLADGKPFAAVFSLEDRRCLAGTVGADYALVLTCTREAIVDRALRRFEGARELLEKEIY